MGVIDKTMHTLTCAGCNKSESVTLLEHGSTYGGSWQSGKPMISFNVVWDKSNSFTGPQICSAVCKTCGEKPEITVS